MKERIKTMFWLYKSKVNSKGLAPIYLRLTKDNERTELSTGKSINPIKWNPKKGRVRGQDDVTQELNSVLEGLLSKVLRIESQFLAQGTDLTLDEIKRRINESNLSEKGFMEYFSEHVDRIRSLVGKDYSDGSLELYDKTRSHFQEYLIKVLKQADLSVAKLDYGVIEGFADYLKTERGNEQNTVIKKVQRLNRVINVLVRKGVLAKNPFAEFRMKKVAKGIVYLSTVELYRIQNKTFDIHRLQLIKDLFIFSCYTGLAYHEVFSLFPKNFKMDDHGINWIVITRKKTNKPQEIPVLPDAQKILDKYIPQNDGKIFPSISNQKLNAYLKEIADCTGINKKLTFHVARKTFATTVTLTKGVSIETVSKILGHSDTEITLGYYAEITKEKVLNEFFHGLNKPVTTK